MARTKRRRGGLAGTPAEHTAAAGRSAAVARRHARAARNFLKSGDCAGAYGFLLAAVASSGGAAEHIRGTGKVYRYPPVTPNRKRPLAVARGMRIESTVNRAVQAFKSACIVKR